MNVSLVGLGHIGKAVVGILNENHGYFKNKFGSDINVISVSDSRTTIYNKKGLNLDKVLMYKERKELDEAAEVIKIDDIYSLPSDIIVDMSPATKDGIAGMRMYKNAFESGKHIVTSNKAPLALHWKEIMESSVAHKKIILYESAVGGGVPLFNLNRYSLKSSKILEFKGQVSSTINFVLNQLMANVDFYEAIKTAQNMGIAETDYHDDTNGLDGARKTVIIANALLGLDYTLNDVKYEGIENLDNIDYMRNSGEIYRVLSHIIPGPKPVVESKIFSIKPTDSLAAMDSLSMGYLEKTDNNDDLTVFEKHDGPLETAAQVVNDILLLS
ncbi:homoserine dehydrogenase [Ferroplasma sp.]|uniref:homoserine dehydrogenase n=1 Tax=Ferroplasma sp. TaxID=2591003 RepID=UPI002611DCAA|nr:homoserine dehydrogenase [Ferroplasma sp.]